MILMKLSDSLHSAMLVSSVAQRLATVKQLERSSPQMLSFQRLSTPDMWVCKARDVFVVHLKLEAVYNLGLESKKENT